MLLESSYSASDAGAELDFEREVVERAAADVDQSDVDLLQYEARVNTYLEKLIRHVFEIDDFWKTMSEMALRDGAEPLHAIRNRIVHIRDLRLEHLDTIREIGQTLHDRTGRWPTCWDRLPTAEAALDAFSKRVIDRWRTLDELERILLKPLTPSNKQLLELAKRFPPPQTWYESDDELVPPVD